MDDLKALRRRKHLSQKALGDLVGVNDNTIRQWENGTMQPRREYIPRLADVLGLDAEQLPALLRATAAEKRRRARAGLRV